MMVQYDILQRCAKSHIKTHFSLKHIRRYRTITEEQNNKIVKKNSQCVISS